MENGASESKRILKIAVGSSNPAKIRAVEQAFLHAIQRSAHPDTKVQIQGFGVASGVPDQPFGDEETCQGAKNRAKSAFAAYRKEHGSPPHMAVGLEGGLERRKVSNRTDLYCMAWMAVYGRRQAQSVDVLASADVSTYFGDKSPIFGLSKTACFGLPSKVSELVEQGMELGDADDKVFNRVKSKHGSGSVGILTDGIVDRSMYYEHALYMALTPWIRPDLYPDGLM